MKYADRPRSVGSVSALLAAVVVTVSAAHADPVYRLVTAEAGIDARFNPNGYPGENSIQTGSAAVGDFNNDGWPDLFIPQGGTGADRLYINQQDGTFEDQAAAWGIDRRTRTAGIAVGDYDNDGYVDLYLVSYGDFPFPLTTGASILYRNLGPDDQGQFRFEDVATEAGVNHVSDEVAGMGATFGDMDLDGDLDLFVAAWIYNTGGNRLYENLGDGTFARVPAERMPKGTGLVRGFTPNFADLDGDRYPELLLTNDFHTSRLYKNRIAEAGDALFEDVTEDAGIVHDCNGMGAVLVDFDRDGRLDWFMTNVFVDAANPPCGNTLYRATDQLTPSGVPVYEEIATDRGVRNAGWAWGVVAFDADNDGDPDLATTGGWPSWLNEPTRLYINDGGGGFADQAAPAGVDWSGQGRGLVHLDYDLDGRVDMLFVERGGPVRLYRNETPDPGLWLRVALDTASVPCLAPQGFGAQVTVTVDGVPQMQIADGRTSYLSQSERTMHFGVGSSAVVDSVEVAWPNGFTTTLFDVPAQQTITIEAFRPSDFDRNGALNFFDITAYLNAYIAGDPRADFDHDGVVGASDLNAFIGRFVGPCG